MESVPTYLPIYLQPFQSNLLREFRSEVEQRRVRPTDRRRRLRENSKAENSTFGMRSPSTLGRGTRNERKADSPQKIIYLKEQNIHTYPLCKTM